MAHTVIDRQTIYDGKKVRLEIHHLEDPDTGRRHKRKSRPRYWKGPAKQALSSFMEAARR